MHFHIITLFPDFFQSPLEAGILGNAVEDKAIEVTYYHLADYKEAENKRVDDVPYGGGAGMLFRPEPVAMAIEAAKKNSPKAKVIHFSPRGNTFTQATAEKLALPDSEYILLCGRYEGIDQRVLDMYVDLELCIGTTIVSGGEFPALTFIDSLARLLPGVLGNNESIGEESFSEALGRETKEYPHYTRPEVWRGISVPEVLISGHHANISKWRHNHTIRTKHLPPM